MTSFSQAPFWLGAIALTAAHFYAEPIRWQRAYFNGTYGWSKVRDLFLSTSLASYLLPFKLGIPLRLLLSARVTGMGVKDLGLIMAADAIVVLLAWSVVTLLVGGYRVVDLLPIEQSWRMPALLIGTAAAALVMGLSPKLRNALATFASELTRVPKRIGFALVIAVIDVLSYGLRHALLAIALGLDPSLWMTWSALGIVATFAGIASGMPMGLIGYDATLILLFSASGAAPAEAALVVASNRGLSLVTAAILGAPAAHRLGLGTGVVGFLKKLKEMASGH